MKLIDNAIVFQNIDHYIDIGSAIWKKSIFLEVSTNNVGFDSTVKKSLAKDMNNYCILLLSPIVPVRSSQIVYNALFAFISPTTHLSLQFTVLKGLLFHPETTCILFRTSLLRCLLPSDNVFIKPFQFKVILLKWYLRDKEVCLRS